MVGFTAYHATSAAHHNYANAAVPHGAALSHEFLDADVLHMPLHPCQHARDTGGAFPSPHSIALFSKNSNDLNDSS